MPKVQKNESEEDYIGRCVKQVMKEGKTQKQALGQCYGMYQQSKDEKLNYKTVKDVCDKLIKKYGIK